jgi:hypothetical protein
LARRILHGRRGQLYQPYRQGQEDQLGALGLVLNMVVLWNTRYLDAVLAQLHAEGYPVRAVFVALHLANKLRAAGSQASDDGVDIVDCECDMADARGVRRRVPVAAPARRGVKLRQLEPSVAVRGLHHRDLRPDALEPHHAVHPTALDRPLALQLESELDEERRRGREVVDHDAHVLHALDRHALDGSDTTAPATASLGCRSAGGNAPRSAARARAA